MNVYNGLTTSYSRYYDYMLSEVEDREWFELKLDYDHRHSCANSALEAFSKNFPRSSNRLGEIAKMRAHERVLVEEATQGHCEAAYRAYLGKTHLFTLDANQFIWEEQQAWQGAHLNEGSSIKGYEDFLKEWPNSIHAATARQCIVGILTEQEQSAWRHAEDRHTVEGYEAFLLTWPRSLHAATAKQRQQEILDIKEKEIWDLVVMKNSHEDYYNFLRDFPKSKHINIAWQRHEDLIKISNMDNFIKKYRFGSDDGFYYNKEMMISDLYLSNSDKAWKLMQISRLKLRSFYFGFCNAERFFDVVGKKIDDAVEKNGVFAILIGVPVIFAILSFLYLSQKYIASVFIEMGVNIFVSHIFSILISMLVTFLVWFSLLLLLSLFFAGLICLISSILFRIIDPQYRHICKDIYSYWKLKREQQKNEKT